MGRQLSKSQAKTIVSFLIDYPINETLKAMAEFASGDDDWPTYGKIATLIRKRAHKPYSPHGSADFDPTPAPQEINRLAKLLGADTRQATDARRIER